MIRFINLTDQIIQNTHEFAFYDTVIDKFVEFNGSQNWDCLEDFVDDFNVDGRTEFMRYYNLMPEQLKKGYSVIFHERGTVTVTKDMKIDDHEKKAPVTVNLEPLKELKFHKNKDSSLDIYEKHLHDLEKVISKAVYGGNFKIAKTKNIKFWEKIVLLFIKPQTKKTDGIFPDIVTFKIFRGKQYILSVTTLPPNSWNCRSQLVRK